MSDRPNILFLQTDQQRWDAVGYANRAVKTPHLDRLAERGVSFSQCVCNAPMCVPSRYSMMLGLYASQVGVRHNAQMIERDELLPVPTLAQRLLDAGYQTAGFGKTHWTSGPMLSLTPVDVVRSRRGFEHRALAYAPDSDTAEPDSDYYALEMPEAYEQIEAMYAEWESGGEGPTGYTGCTSPVDPQHHAEAYLTAKALDFLDRKRDRRRPFFCYLSFDYPHAGFAVPAGYEDRYRLDDIPDMATPPDDAQLDEHIAQLPHTQQWTDIWRAKSPLERRQTTLKYYALCSYVDDLFGQVLDRLQEQGELDNTFVMFNSDHGESLGERYRFSKYSLYEGSVRVPMLIAGPGVDGEHRGGVDARPAELVDVMPTLLDVAQVPMPDVLPGHSLLRPSTRPGAFAEMHGVGCEPIQHAPAYMWRTPEWKLILSLPDGVPDAVARPANISGELYHLAVDPIETRNLYDDPQHHAVRQRLTAELLMHLAVQWAKYPRCVASPTLHP